MGKLLRRLGNRASGDFCSHSGSVEFGPGRHGRYLARLARAAEADYEWCEAVAALTPDDREWLTSTGWHEPTHASFVRLNGWRPRAGVIGLQADA